MLRAVPLEVEQLEERWVPASWGSPWPSPERITVSFVPDGTPIGSHESDLFSTLGNENGEQSWQREMLHALQTWSVHTDLDIVVVPDNGLPMGTTGVIQADPRFGDIRIAAFPMEQDLLGFAIPFDITAGTWAGDLVLNSRALDQIEAEGNLFPLLLHESGHAFGLPHLEEPESVMLSHTELHTTALSEADVMAIQRLYGTRSQDEWEGARGNNDLQSATVLEPEGGTLLFIKGDLTTEQDVDFYRLEMPEGVVKITLNTGDFGLLQAHLTLLDQNGNPVSQLGPTDPLRMGKTALELSTLGGVWYLKVEGAAQALYRTGEHGITIERPGGGVVARVTREMPSHYPVQAAGANADLLYQMLSLSPGNDFESALDTRNFPKTSPTHHAFLLGGKLKHDHSEHFFRAQAPTHLNGPLTMTVGVWLIQGEAVPSLQIYNEQRSLIPSRVLVNQNGALILQSEWNEPGSLYYVQVKAPDKGAQHSLSTYFLGLTFGNHRIELSQVANGFYNGSGAQEIAVLNLPTGQVRHFVLTLGGAPAASGTAIVRFISDAGLQFEKEIRLGGTSTFDVFLESGLWRVEMLTIEGSSTFHYSVEVHILSGSLGPLKHQVVQQTVPLVKAAVRAPGVSSPPVQVPERLGALPLILPTSSPDWVGRWSPIDTGASVAQSATPKVLDSVIISRVDLQANSFFSPVYHLPETGTDRERQLLDNEREKSIVHKGGLDPIELSSEIPSEASETHRSLHSLSHEPPQNGLISQSGKTEQLAEPQRENRLIPQELLWVTIIALLSLQQRALKKQE